MPRSARAGVRAFLVAASTTTVGACRGPLDTLNTAAPAADRLALQSIVLSGISIGVVVLVALAAVVPMLRARRDRRGQPPSRINVSRWLVGCTAVTVGILLGVFFYVLHVLGTSESTPPPGTMVVELTGHQWWWEVYYPEQDVRTANTIHLPVGTPVEIKVESSDVIHSFWVPRLNGKVDLVPGQTNRIVFRTNSPGSYLGVCAEYCGLQHAHMGLEVVAEPAAEFDSWLERQSRPAAAPTDADVERGRAAFVTNGCGSCHTVRGTEANGQLGPDLTHLATRSTIAAGTVPNTRGFLGGWIVDPQSIKPGSLMPNIDVPGDELDALITYLQTLD